MTTYYCDLTADFADRSGADSGANVLTGPGGWRCAMTGGGAATALAASDTLFLYGLARGDRLVRLTCGKDVSAWVIGDVVVDNNTGAEWTGKVVELNVAADTTKILVQVNSPKDVSHIVLVSGINNTTRADTTTLSAKTAEPITFDQADGSAAGGFIRHIGVTAAWANDGTLAGSDMNSAAAHVLYIKGADWLWLENIEATRAGATNYDGVFGNNTETVFVVLNNIYSHANGRYGVNPGFLIALRMQRCRCNLNVAGAGIYRPLGTAIIFGCEAIDNGSRGMDLSSSGTVLSASVMHSNVTDELYIYGNNFILNCVIDGGPTDGAEAGFNTCPWFVGCRFTSNVTHGLNVSGVGSRVLLTGCYFCDNGEDIHSSQYDSVLVNGVSLVTLAGGAGEVATEYAGGDEGGAGHDFNITDGSTYDSVAIPIE